MLREEVMMLKNGCVGDDDDDGLRVVSDKVGGVVAASGLIPESY